VRFAASAKGEHRAELTFVYRESIMTVWVADGDSVYIQHTNGRRQWLCDIFNLHAEVAVKDGSEWLDRGHQRELIVKRSLLHKPSSALACCLEDNGLKVELDP
jgi:hypothetical protein